MSVLDAAGEFFGLYEVARCGDCNFPEPFFLWSDCDRTLSDNREVLANGNLFRFLVHCVNPQLKEENLLGKTNYNPLKGTYTLTTEEAEATRKILAFFAEDHKELEENPIEWSQITGLGKLLQGVEVGLESNQKHATVQWNSTVGKMVRKNKIALALYQKPADGVLKLTLGDMRMIINKVSHEKLSEGVRNEIKVYEIFAN